jgi:8-oxo-dGTP diphosphatase
MDLGLIAAIEVVPPTERDELLFERGHAVLCVMLREVGGDTSSHVAVPLRTDLAGRRVIEQHVQAAAERIPTPPQPWPEGFAEMSEKPLTPKVGVGVMVMRVHDEGDREVLLGLRKGSHGAGEWSLPGGHLELGETPRACARRELFEETGISVKELTELGWSNDVMPEEGLHYVTLFLSVNLPGDTEAELKEPDKTEEWKWFKLHEQPSNIFAPTAKLLRAWKYPDRMFS